MGISVEYFWRLSSNAFNPRLLILRINERTVPAGRFKKEDNDARSTPNR